MAQTQSGLDSEIDTFLLSGSDITAATLRQVLHDMNAAAFQSGVTALGSPTAQIGLTTITGSATTAMRSDAAPAIAQSIAPTWTGLHIFSNATPSSSTSTGAVTVTGGVGIAGALNIGSTINAGGSIYINLAPVEAAQRVSGSVSGTVAFSDYSMTIPAGATVTGLLAYTTTAFLASGTVQLSCGSAVGDNLYMSGTGIKSQGGVTSSFSLVGTAVVNLASMPATSPNFFLRIGQGGTPSGTGNVTIIVRYLVT